MQACAEDVSRLKISTETTRDRNISVSERSVDLLSCLLKDNEDIRIENADMSNVNYENIIMAEYPRVSALRKSTLSETAPKA